MAKDRRVKFRRIGGRIIPIREKRAAQSIISATRGTDALSLAAIAAAGLGGIFGAGKIAARSDKLLSRKSFRASTALNKLAKFTKFGSKFGAATAAGAVLTGIDRRAKDEGANVFNLGNKTGAANVAAAGLTAFAFGRLGKRFEKFGLRGGKFPVKLRDI